MKILDFERKTCYQFLLKSQYTLIEKFYDADKITYFHVISNTINSFCNIIQNQTKFK